MWSRRRTVNLSQGTYDNLRRMGQELWRGTMTYAILGSNTLSWCEIHFQEPVSDCSNKCWSLTSRTTPIPDCLLRLIGQLIIKRFILFCSVFNCSPCKVVLPNRNTQSRREGNPSLSSPKQQAVDKQLLKWIENVLERKLLPQQQWPGEAFNFFIENTSFLLPNTYTLYNTSTKSLQQHSNGLSEGLQPSPNEMPPSPGESFILGFKEWTQ